jgi:diguanylate cyclase (GGDEF)-like protein
MKSRKYNATHHRDMEKESRDKYVQFMLDANPSFLITTTGKTLEYINKTFLNFLGYSSLEDFKDKHSCIDEFIVSINGETYPHDKHKQEGWVRNIIKNPDTDHIIHLHRTHVPEGEAVTAHLVACTPFPHIDKYILSFTDITNIENERRYLKQQATTDALTGICNRNGFNHALSVEIQRAQRYGSPLSLMMMDIDHFKNINDTFGHNTGDDILRNLTKIVSENIRTYDIFARWGGEEFIILAPHTDTENAVLLAEKLRVAIESSDFAPVSKLTCSFGVTGLVKENCVAREIVDNADKALYEAKRNGRNMVCVR